MADYEVPTISRESSLVKRSLLRNSLDSLNSNLDQIKETFENRTNGEQTIEFNNIDDLLTDLSAIFPFDFEGDRSFFSIDNKSIIQHFKSK